MDLTIKLYMFEGCDTYFFRKILNLNLCDGKIGSRKSVNWGKVTIPLSLKLVDKVHAVPSPSPSIKISLTGSNLFLQPAQRITMFSVTNINTKASF